MYDTHTHSDFSDGVLPPEKLIEQAFSAGLTIIGLTDHDTLAGLPRAKEAAERFGIPLLPGTEIEADFSAQLHILGLGVDPDGEKLKTLIGLHAERRKERNRKLLKKLADGGMSVYDHIAPTNGLINKSNIALAMVAAGYCKTPGEAFDRYLKKGRPFDVRQEYPTMPEVMEAILDAGGYPVLAHPMKMRCDHDALIKDMKDHGLWGVEAYYSTATPADTEFFRGLAEKYSLRLTCGSDFHGPHRPEAQLGCAWRNAEELISTEELLKEKCV
ncbi:MAG: PHP domain-containing protein [Clostridiales bacterium]|nr:PHP domain-containing protein [Clostridiales bacterium]